MRSAYLLAIVAFAGCDRAVPDAEGSPEARAADAHAAARPWDGHYKNQSRDTDSLLCPMADSATDGADVPLTVSGGTLSFAWKIRVPPDYDHVEQVGGYTGVINGKGVATATPLLVSSLPPVFGGGVERKVLMKKLAAMPLPSIVFTRVHGGRQAHLVMKSPICDMMWVASDPHVPAASSAPSHGPASTAPPHSSSDDRGAEEREHDRESRRVECTSQCSTVFHRCDQRCEDDDAAGTRRCNDARSACGDHLNDGTPGCSDSDLGRCLSEVNNTHYYTCDPRCKQDLSSCEDSCNR